MKLVVISPEGERADEADALSEMVALGLGRYHVRKPAWSHEQLRVWLSSLDRLVRMRCVLHTHHDLVESQVLLGRHWRGSHAVPVQPGPGFSSRSCHTLDELEPTLGVFSSVFFSPVFPSISKVGRLPNSDLTLVSTILRSRSERLRSTDVLALGGLDASRITSAAAWGFDGVAVLGAVWHAENPVEAFRRIQDAVEVYHAA